MAKVNVNGVTREMTAEEIEQINASVTMPEPSYGEMVNDEIRKRYSVSQELAILRQKDEKPEEYAEYYGYCEECKRKVKRISEI